MFEILKALMALTKAAEAHGSQVLWRVDGGALLCIEVPLGNGDAELVEQMRAMFAVDKPGSATTEAVAEVLSSAEDLLRNDQEYNADRWRRVGVEVAKRIDKVLRNPVTTDDERTALTEMRTRIVRDVFGLDLQERGQDMTEPTSAEQGRPPLPTDEDGEIITSASFGEAWLVKIEYNTDFDGREIDPGKEEYPCTLHGEFFSQEEAVEWMNAYPDGDTDIHDITAVNMNRVRPA